MADSTEPRRCNDCDVLPGERHHEGCDVARCTVCGGQRLGCPCLDGSTDTWTGLWPGTELCREKGWVLDARDPVDGGPWPDLNRLAVAIHTGEVVPPWVERPA